MRGLAGRTTEWKDHGRGWSEISSRLLREIYGRFLFQCKFSLRSLGPTHGCGHSHHLATAPQTQAPVLPAAPASASGASWGELPSSGPTAPQNSCSRRNSSWGCGVTAGAARHSASCTNLVVQGSQHASGRPSTKGLRAEQLSVSPPGLCRSLVTDRVRCLWNSPAPAT